MSDIFQEVEQAVRQDRYVHLWKRYGNFVIAGAVGVVVLTAGIVGFRHYQQSQRLADSAAYAAAARLEESDPAAAAAAFKALAERGGGGYGDLARLRQAAALGRQGDVAGAVAIYDRIAARGGDRTLGELAELKAARLLLDSGDAAGARDRVERLVADDAPWHHMARELKALALFLAGDRTGAAALFKSLAEDATAPPGLRGRARDMLAVLGLAEQRG